MNSFWHALEGLWYVLRFERNARIHLVSAIVVSACGLLLRVSEIKLIAIFFAIIIVFLAEIFNTAVEKTLDLIDVKNNPRIKIIKDMSAGGVLVAAAAAAVVGVVIFAPYLRDIWGG